MTYRWKEWIATCLILCISLLGARYCDDYWAYVGTLAALRAIMAVGYDVLLGYTGFLSMAHGTLFGIGAYACAILTANYHWSFWLAMPVASALTAAIGAIVGAVSFRATGFYFAVLTLGIGLIGFQIFTVSSITGGVQGFVGIPPLPPIPGLNASPQRYALYVTLVILAITYLAASAFVRSPLGGACKALREDTTLARSLGISVGLARMSAFTFSSFFAGAAGALYASISSFIAPESFSVMGVGFDVVVFVIVGGMGTLWGPMLGAALLTFIPELLRVARTFSLLGYGIVLLVFVIFAPKGIAGLVSGASLTKLPRVFGRRSRAERDAPLSAK